MRLLLIVLALGFLTSPVQAHHVKSHPNDVTVKVDGLVCDFCAQTISTLFKKKEQVEKVDINMDTHEVTLDFKPGATLANEDITGVIDYAGYKVVEIIR